MSDCSAWMNPAPLATCVPFFLKLPPTSPLTGYDPDSRREVMDLAHRTRDALGRLMKVLPTALVASAMRPSIARRELVARADALVATLIEAGANLAVRSGEQAVAEGTQPLVDRNIIFVERGGRFRVRERTVLRYYARSLEHLLTSPRRPSRMH